MQTGFYILRKLETGEAVCVACRETLRQAEQLVANLQELWPADYCIQKERNDERPVA